MQELNGLVDAAIADLAINKGVSFAAFNLPNANIVTWSLSGFLSNGLLIISLYRVARCPYCILEINALQRRLPDKSVEQLNNSQLSLEILSDIGNVLAKDCGLVFTLPESLAPLYDAWQIDIPGHNGSYSFELPVQAAYIVDTGGKVAKASAVWTYTTPLKLNIIIERLIYD